MIYEFESDDGRRIEVNIPMSEAPPIGSVREVDGVAYRRCLPRIIGVSVPYNGVSVSQRLEPWHPLAPRCNSEGQPVFLNKGEETEFASRTQDTESPVVRT